MAAKVKVAYTSLGFAHTSPRLQLTCQFSEKFAKIGFQDEPPCLVDVHPLTLTEARFGPLVVGKDALDLHHVNFHASRPLAVLVDVRADGIVGDFSFNPGLLRSEEHTSELQSRVHLVCRLMLE